MLDSLLQFSNAQALTATAVSTNIVDLSVARDMGVSGEEYPLMLEVTGDNLFASATSAATLTIAIQGAPDSNGSPGTYYDMATSEALTITQLNSGIGTLGEASGSAGGTKLFSIDLPETPPGKTMPRFLRVNYTVGTENFSAGHVSAYLQINRQTSLNQAAYPSGFTVAN